MQRELTLTAEQQKFSITANLVRVTKAQARRYALRILGIVWGIGIVTIPIPLIHFVSVPVCLFAGPLMAWLVYRLWSHTEEWVADFSCGACQVPMVIKVNRHFDETSRRCRCGTSWQIK